MAATSKTLPLLPKLVLVLGMLCGFVFAQAGAVYSSPNVCATAGAAQADKPVAAVSCQCCCAEAACCLLSKKSPDTSGQREPLSTAGSRPLDHAPVALGPLSMRPCVSLAWQKPTFLAGDKRFALPVGRAPRGAVSCIWLI
jgi:hypothetical protein